MTGCCIRDCTNKNKKGLYMATLPINPEKRELWISRIQNFSNTYLPKKHHRICQAHFAEHMWETVRCDGKLKLKNNAVPTIFPSYVQPCGTISLDNNDENMSEMDIAIDHRVNKEDIEANQQLQLKNIIENIISEDHVNEDINESTTPEEHLNKSINESLIPTDHLNEQRKENLEKQYENITNLLEKSRQKCKNLENYIKKQDEQFSKIIKKNHKYKTMIKKRLKKWKTDFQTYEKVKTMMSKVFNEDQVKAFSNPNKRTVWSNETIQRAIRLKLTCGSSGYEEILKQNIPLPSERTLRRNIETIEFKGGVCNGIFEILSNKVQTFTDEKDKDCMLTMDEMSITSGTTFDQSTQLYCGYTTLPDNSKEIATHALVFTIGSICARWKQVVAYYFTPNSLDGSLLKPIVKLLSISSYV